MHKEYFKNFEIYFEKRDNTLVFKLENMSKILDITLYKDEFITYESLIEINQNKSFETWLNKIYKTMGVYKPVKENKIGYIYVFTTDILGIYKIGKTTNIYARKSTANTMLVNDIRILYQIETDCPGIVEKYIHEMLDEFRISDRELFKSDIAHIIQVIEEVVNFTTKLKNLHKKIKIEKDIQDEVKIETSKFVELHLKRKPGSGVNWTELYEYYEKWYRENHGNVILNKKKVKMYFENQVFKKNIIPVSREIGRGWCGWTLIK
jgi:hypothetical protein